VAIFTRLKTEFKKPNNHSQTYEAIIFWYTQMFKTFSESLFDQHQDIFEGLIVNLDFRNANLVKKIMTLVCMLGTKNEHYSQKVMEQLIERFY
jgi:hypothetical protein